MDEVSERIKFFKRIILFIVLLIIYLITCVVFFDNPITRVFNIICIIADIWAIRKNIIVIKELKKVA